MQVGYDDGILQSGIIYSVGTNDGKEFREIQYVGQKLMNGKPCMVFVTGEGSQLTVNPSYHTFTLEHLDKTTEKDNTNKEGESDGEIKRSTSY
jgi:putative NADPH-quinone reductase|tara:strand:- start:265 stop:543 length:279 start_codon:yes stop_codon:yes gene_type:complete